MHRARRRRPAPSRNAPSRRSPSEAWGSWWRRCPGRAGAARRTRDWADRVRPWLNGKELRLAGDDRVDLTDSLCCAGATYVGFVETPAVARASSPCMTRLCIICYDKRVLLESVAV